MAKALPKQKVLPGVNQIIMVASGKGGVGKSTTSVNLSVALASLGHRVGLLDADLFGPSIPLMMGLSETPLVDDRNRIIPVVNYNVKWCDTTSPDTHWRIQLISVLFQCQFRITRRHETGDMEGSSGHVSHRATAQGFSLGAVGLSHH